MNDEHKDHNKVLASPPASHLGKIHWHILRDSTFIAFTDDAKVPMTMFFRRMYQKT